MLSPTSTLDPNKLPKYWAEYLEKVKNPIKETNDLFSGQRLSGGASWKQSDGTWLTMSSGTNTKDLRR